MGYLRNLGQAIVKLLLAIDYFMAFLITGKDDVTISSEIGRAWRGDYGPRWRWWAGAPRRWLNALFRFLTGQKDHAADSIIEPTTPSTKGP